MVSVLTILKWVSMTVMNLLGRLVNKVTICYQVSSRVINRV